MTNDETGVEGRGAMSGEDFENGGLEGRCTGDKPKARLEVALQFSLYSSPGSEMLYIYSTVLYQHRALGVLMNTGQANS